MEGRGSTALRPYGSRNTRPSRCGKGLRQSLLFVNMKKVRFYPDAEIEMTEAATYYEKQQPDLGKRFLTAVQDAVNRVVVNPRLYPVVELDVRRCLTKTFPFGVLFRERPDEIIVVAVMHLHRDPDYWKHR
ncbi:type II toxin-antitoxin system RelE/ParE family toxin [Desulfonatronum lacustre]|uniref:type II toxin-antitoxin system RelE/ParE family toxin n=1 Tax=Desulfonatronum lacustre TaxID=66849 RepID=UPI00338FD98D